MGANTAVVTDDTFATDVLKSEKTVLVDFWAEWCGPCRAVAPILEEIAGEHADDITHRQAERGREPAGAAASYGIVSIPTLSVFQGGELVKQIVGAKPKVALLKDLAPFLA